MVRIHYNAPSFRFVRSMVGRAAFNVGAIGSIPMPPGFAMLLSSNDRAPV